MEPKKYSLLGSFRRAINKVKFLLSFSANRWVLSSIFGSSRPLPRRVSFKTPPSLLDGVEDGSLPNAISRTTSLGASVSRTSSSDSTEMASTSSGMPSPGDEDVDRRAEQFIQNFYRHIQMERQVSLELRYHKEKGLERAPSR